VVFSWYLFAVTGMTYYFFLDYRKKWAAAAQLALVVPAPGEIYAIQILQFAPFLWVNLCQMRSPE